MGDPEQVNEALEIFKLVMKRLDGMDAERTEARAETNKKLDDFKAETTKKLDAIHTQTLATNGRVTVQERNWERVKGALTLLAFAGTVAGAAVISHFWPG